MSEEWLIEAEKVEIWKKLTGKGLSKEEERLVTGIIRKELKKRDLSEVELVKIIRNSADTKCVRWAARELSELGKEAMGNLDKDNLSELVRNLPQEFEELKIMAIEELLKKKDFKTLSLLFRLSAIPDKYRAKIAKACFGAAGLKEKKATDLIEYL